MAFQGGGRATAYDVGLWSIEALMALLKEDALAGTGGYTKSKERGFRKLAMSFWDRPKDGTIYGSSDLNVLKTRIFQNAVKEKFGVRPTIGQLMGRALAEGLKRAPEGNAKIIWGQAYLKESIDVYYQVDVEDGKDLSGVVVPDVGGKTCVDVARELRDRADKLRKGKDIQYEKTQKGLLPKLPSWMLRPILWGLTFLEYNLGITATWAGAKPEPFGTVMVTNVSSFQVDQAYAPLVPVSRVPLIVLIGQVTDQPWVVDRKLCVRPVVNGSATIDHRIMDGNKIGRLIRVIKDYMQNPYPYETELGLEDPWPGIDPPADHVAASYPEGFEPGDSF